jgi:hypothetical protein
VKTRILCLTIAAVFCIVTAGCNQVTQTRDVFGPYYMTTLKMSTSSDVVNAFSAADGPVSQSRSVVASYGTADNGTEVWFNMVAFAEDGAEAVRKYAILADENAGAGIFSPKRSLRFDAQVVVPAAVLNAAYDSENSRRIAILKMLRENLNSDLKQVSFDSADLRGAALLAMHTLNTVVQTLEDSPANAVQLDTTAGMSFDTMNMGRARIRMLISNDVATVKIKAGILAEGFENQPDVKNM